MCFSSTCTNLEYFQLTNKILLKTTISGLDNAENIVGKGERLLTSIFSFSHYVLNASLRFCGKGLQEFDKKINRHRPFTFSHTMICFQDNQKELAGKGENAGNQHLLLF